MVSRFEWRLWIIVIALVISVLATAVVYYFGLWQAPDTHMGAVFASWVGSIALFVVVGATVAVVSLARPEREPFDARARILFRRQSGPHIDYIISRIQTTLEHYAENTYRRVIVDDYVPGEKKYHVGMETTTTVRSYIDDVTSTYSSKIYMKTATAPPAGRTGHRLVYLRINGVAEGAGQEIQPGEFSRNFATTIQPDSPCVIEGRTEVWIDSDSEPNTHRPVRYTQKFSLEIENRLMAGQQVVINLSRDGGTSWQEHRILAGDRKMIFEALECVPEKQLYDFRVLGA